MSLLGISFWNAPLPNLFQELWAQRGLLVVPAAPALAELPNDASYEAAVIDADFAIIDSALVALILVFKTRGRIERISGLRFMQGLLLGEERPRFVASRVLWVVPQKADAESIQQYLRTIALASVAQEFYEAPFYGSLTEFQDAALFTAIESFRPDCVIICIGGGKQEKLGLALRNRFPRQFPILCTGAAIAFMTGAQVKIPTWADRAGLGWLFRTLHNPRTFGPRYFRAAWKFPVLLFRYRPRSLER